MFRALTIVSVIAAVLAAVKFAGGPAGGPSKNAPRMGRYPVIEALIAFVMWCSLLVLAGTGFLGATMFGRALSGYLILIHTACGAVFAASFALLAVFRAEACSLAEPDTCGRFSAVQKICFWIIGLGGLGLIFSILIAMFPLLGTDGQHVAVQVHKGSALAVLIATIIYAGAASRRG